MLISVHKSGQKKSIVPLEPTSNLTNVREILEGRKLMLTTDRFLKDDSELAKSDEVTIRLSDILTGTKGDSLSIGSATTDDPLDPGDDVQRYIALSDAQKNSLFKTINIFNGLVVSNNGLSHGTERLYSWKFDGRKFPNALSPDVVAQINYSFTFNEAVNSIKRFTSESASVDLDTPVASASANFKDEQSKTTTKETVTQYISGKFTLRKMKLNLKAENIVLNPKFEQELNKAIQKADDFQKYIGILTVLKEWGHYVPLKFTLGGYIYATDSTEISKFSEAEEQKTSFGGSFKASFNGIGGGAAYEKAEGSETKTSKTNKFQNIQTQYFGGRADATKDYETWSKSLNNAAYWRVASYDEFIPTIALVNDPHLLDIAIQLMDKYAFYPNAVEFQPLLDMKKYGTTVQELVADPTDIWS